MGSDAPPPAVEGPCVSIRFPSSSGGGAFGAPWIGYLMGRILNGSGGTVRQVQ